MAPPRNLVSTESQGKIIGVGVYFDDIPPPQDLNHAAIKRISVTHDIYIRSLTVHYGSEQGVRHGGPEGTVSEVILEPNEFITTVEGNVAGSAFGKLSFITNKGKVWGPYGQTSSETSFSWSAAETVSAELAPHMGLLYFSGYADPYIRLLRATFATYKNLEPPPSVVKYERVYIETNTAPSAIASSFAKNLNSPIVQLLVGQERVPFHAYEAILCRLPFFRAALQGEFRESTEKRIIMPEDEPEAVAAMIEFLFTGNYTYAYGTTTSSDGGDTPAGDFAEGCFHIGIYAVAFKYDCQQLVKEAIRGFTYILKRLKGIDVVRLWEAAYMKGLVLSEWEDDGNLSAFRSGMAMLLKEVYETHREDMESMVLEYPALASDFLRLVVSTDSAP